METIKIRKTLRNAKMPQRSSQHAAGYDLFATDSHRIAPGERRMFDTGVSIAIPEGYYGRIAPRSGLALRGGIDCLGGVIDSDYRGSIGVILVNLDRKDSLSINEGDRIAQLVICPVLTPELEWSDELPESKRNVGGFGSTGK